MCNSDIKGWKFVCMGVEYKTFNVLLHTKSEQTVKNRFFNKKYIYYNLCRGCLNCNEIFIIRKTEF